jgi:hypothetical protein
LDVSNTLTIQQIFKTKGCEIRKGGKGFLTNALHRPDKNPSLSVFQGKGGGWIAHDFSTGESWPLWKYLEEYAGYGRYELVRLGLFEERPKKDDWRLESKTSRVLNSLRAAAQKILEPIAFAPTPNAKPPAEAENTLMDALSRLADTKATGYLRQRGFTRDDAADLGIGVLEDGSLVFPEYDLPGSPIRNLKVRNAQERAGRFRYLFKGVGNGFAMFGDWQSANAVAIVEGEVNAASFYLATSGKFVIAIPGASKGLTEPLAMKVMDSGKLVELWFDNDEAGRKGLEKVKAQLLRAGIEPMRIVIPKENPIKDIDLNNIFCKQGRAGLAEHIKKRLGRSGRVARSARKSGKALVKYLDGVQDARTGALRVGYESHKSMIRCHRTQVNPWVGIVEAVIERMDKREMVRRAYRRLYLKDPAFSVIINLVAAWAADCKARTYDLQVAIERLGAERVGRGDYDIPALGFIQIRGRKVEVLDWDDLVEWAKAYAGIADWEEGNRESWFTFFLEKMAIAKDRFTRELCAFFRFIGRTFNGRPLPEMAVNFSP